MDRVVVVGAGVIGLCTALRLREQGCDVTVLDRGAAGHGASWGNAGWIVPSLSAPLAAPGAVGEAVRALIRPGGAVRLNPVQAVGTLPWLWQFRRACSAEQYAMGRQAMAALSQHALSAFDELAADGVEFALSRTGLLSAFVDEAVAERARGALGALAEIGYPMPDLETGDRLRALEPVLSDRVRAGFVVTQEAAVDPQSLVCGLVKQLGVMGVPVREHWPVEALEWQGDQARAVLGSHGRLPADHVVVTAGAWTSTLLPRAVRLPLQAGKGYSMTLRLPSSPRTSLYFPEAKVGLVPTAAGGRLAGTMDLSGLDEDIRRRRLRAVRRDADRYLTGAVPGWSDGWTGLRSLTPDGLPVLSRLAATNVTVGCGHAMLGVTLAPLSGTALAQLTLGLPPTIDLSPFRADRFGSRAASPHRHLATSVGGAR